MECLWYDKGSQNIYDMIRRFKLSNLIQNWFILFDDKTITFCYTNSKPEYFEGGGGVLSTKPLLLNYFFSRKWGEFSPIHFPWLRHCIEIIFRPSNCVGFYLETRSKLFYKKKYKGNIEIASRNVIKTNLKPSPIYYFIKFFSIQQPRELYSELIKIIFIQSVEKCN